MSIYTDPDGIVTGPPHPDGGGAEWSPPALGESVPAVLTEPGNPAPAGPIAQFGPGEPVAAITPASPETSEARVAPEATNVQHRARRRRGWLGVVAVSSIGVIASGTLGYFLYTTTGQRDAALHKVAATQATLTDTQVRLNTTQNDLNAFRATAAYTSMYIGDGARTRVDYQKLVACTTFGPCRTAAQAALTDMQTFQSDRSAATVPAALSNFDAMLRDALSAAIAADQELISGLDSGNSSKIDQGFRKLNAAMLSMAKAETVLGTELK